MELLKSWRKPGQNMPLDKWVPTLLWNIISWIPYGFLQPSYYSDMGSGISELENRVKKPSYKLWFFNSGTPDPLWNLHKNIIYMNFKFETSISLTLLPVTITWIWWLGNWKYFDVISLQWDEFYLTIFLKKIIWHNCNGILVIFTTLANQ